MKLVPVALLYLSSLAFLGADSAQLDVAAEFRKKWNKWALSRGKRELRVSSSSPTGLADLKAGLAETIVQPQDVKGPSRGAQARCLPFPLQRPGHRPHPRQALPPEYEPIPRSAELRLPLRDVQRAEAGAPDLPADRQG
uniref:Adrenomedullin n=1 Tax=Pipistrellus kuhlii TaxID=59472 RepID=A0A7J7WYC6_PIPKU|nr:adrenomedullin [Pipistrellus kuhlii]